MLYAQAQNTVEMALPNRPLRGHLPSRPSIFICPISGSVALRRFRGFANARVMPRRWLLIRMQIMKLHSLLSYAKWKTDHVNV